LTVPLSGRIWISAFRMIVSTKQSLNRNCNLSGRSLIAKQIRWGPGHCDSQRQWNL
jgi:hypothetical protein